MKNSVHNRRRVYKMFEFFLGFDYIFCNWDEAGWTIIPPQNYLFQEVRGVGRLINDKVGNRSPV